MSATKISGKVHKSTIYKTVISDLVHICQWRKVIKEELQNLKNYHTCKYNQLLANRRIIRLKWVFKVKYHPDRLIDRYKLIPVSQGLSQIYDVNFNKTFFPIVRRKSLWIFLVILCLFDFIIKQVDIVDAYFESLLGDNSLFIFMKLPSKIEKLQTVKAGLIYRLLWSIYKIRQSDCLWNQKVTTFFWDFGFVILNAGLSILIHWKSNDNTYITLISIYVDNFLLAAKD